MQGKDHKESSIIGLTLGVIVAALTTWLVMLLRQRAQPPNHTQTTEAFSEGMDKLEVKPISSQDHQMESVPAPNPPVEAVPASPSADAVFSSAKKTNVWSLPTKYMIGAGLVFFIFWVFYFSRGSILMIVFAGLLALVASGAIDFLKKRFKMKNGTAITITYSLIVIILISIPLLVLPAIASTLASMINVDWTTLVNNVVERLDQIAAQLSMIPVVGSRLQASLTALADLLLEQLTTSAQNVAAPVVTLESMVGKIGNTLGTLASVLGPIISGMVSLVFLLLLSMQITIGGGAVRKGLVDVLPPAFKDEINPLLDGIIFIWKSFLSGQVLLMFVMGVATWLLNGLLGTPYPLFLGIIAGFLELIPSLGPVIAWIPAAILALVFGSTRFVEMDPFVFALIVSAGYLLLSGLENQILVPRIMGNAVNLPPVVVLIGCIVGGSTLGIAGIFLAVPMMATGKEVFLYLYGKVLETEEDLSQPETKEGVNRSFRQFLQSTTTRIRGWFGSRKNKPPE